LSWWPTKWRTTYRPNGHPNVTEIVHGWDRILPWAALFITIISGIIAITSQIQKTTTKVEGLETNLPALISAHVTNQIKADAFVTREEWLRDKTDQDKALQSVNDTLQKELDFFTRYDDRQQHILGVVEKLGNPPPKETPK
jgi:hypothetical protein